VPVIASFAFLRRQHNVSPNPQKNAKDAMTGTQSDFAIFDQRGA
jgi:hypothetical protein